MRKFVILLPYLFFAIALGACSASNVINETPEVAQPTKAKFVSSTSTAQAVPTTFPLTPTTIAEAFATQDANSVTSELSATPDYEECSLRGHLTTNGDWVLCDPLTDPITIINTSNQTWQFSYRLFYGKEVSNPCTRLLYTTSDIKYLYFSLDSDCILTEPGFVTSISVFRMNLINGEVSETLKASYNFETNDGNYYSVSISPTGRRMAYIYPQESPMTLNILDIQTGKNRSFLLEEIYTSGGMFLWSESGTKLAFKLESKKDYDYFISIVFLDLLKDNSPVTFIKDKDYFWISSRLEITDEWVRVIPIDGDALIYDIETGILRPEFQ